MRAGRSSSILNQNGSYASALGDRDIASSLKAVPLAVPGPHTLISKPHQAPKILIYSHDTVGLGNIRRTLVLAEHLHQEFIGSAILIATGSPVIHAYKIPAGVDYVKIPSLNRVEADTYEPRFLTQWASEIKQTRQEILRTTILGFEPDLMIVDKRPTGVDGELLPTLQELRRSGSATRLVLGIRDILDSPRRTRNSLRKTEAFESIERFFDEVWIYGAREIFDQVKEYHYPDSVAKKTIYCGYLQRATTTRTHNHDVPHVLVMTGGGSDGHALLEAYLEGLLDLPRRMPLRSTVIFGPEMPVAQQERLRQRYGHLGDVAFEEFVDDLTPYYASADLVVSMAGYNTVCELLSFGQRAILVPRAEPVREQLIRARRFAKFGYFDYIEPDELTAKLLLTRVLNALQNEAAPLPAIDLDGLARISERARALLAERM